MIKRAVCMLSVVSLLSTPALGQTLSERTSHALRCLIASSLLVVSKDEKIKAVGVIGATFFAGEVFGGEPDIDLTAAMRAEASKLRPEDFSALEMQCGAEMKARGAEITAAGRALKSEAGRPPPS